MVFQRTDYCWTTTYILTYLRRILTVETKKLDSIRSNIHTMMGGRMISPEKLITSTQSKIIYTHHDIVDSNNFLSGITGMSGEDIFIDLNITQTIPNRCLITDDQKMLIDNIYRAILRILKNNYACIDLLLEMYDEGETKPQHIVYYNILEQRMISNNESFMLPYEELFLGLGRRRYVGTHLFTKENNRIYYTPKILHFQFLSDEVIRSLLDVGYDTSMVSVNIHHTLDTATARLRTILLMLDKSKELNALILRQKQIRYGTKIKDTYDLYRTFTQLSDDEKTKRYKLIGNRVFNFFESVIDTTDNTDWYIDVLLYELL